MEIQVGTRVIRPPSAQTATLSMLLWGLAGCGKSTLAATAPGKKLWILFDRDGLQSLTHRDDVLVLDLSGETHFITQSLKDDNPFGLEKILNEHPEIETVVFDSVSSYSILCAENAVMNVRSATVENLGIKGYGHRTALTLRALTALSRLTSRLKRNFICIAHEATPDKNEDGSINFITVALSGNTTNQVSAGISEVWWMSDTGKERRIAVRPVRQRIPMKTRMFAAGAVSEFVWKFDADTWKGEGIADWFQRWKDADGQKIPLPK